MPGLFVGCGQGETMWLLTFVGSCSYGYRTQACDNAPINITNCGEIDMKSITSTLAIAGIAAAVLLSQAGCTESSEEVAVDNPVLDAPVPDGMVRGTVAETMDSGGYTYVLLQIGDEQRWLAGPQTSIDVGDTIQTTQGMAMAQFSSKTLNRTFEVIYFVETLDNLTRPVMPENHPVISQDVDTAAADPDVAPVEPGQDIAWVYANRDSVAGQQVALRGKVVKYNANILGSNFLHIRDGSGSASDGSNDLIVTTGAEVAVGDTVVVTGNIVLDKDFGSVYQYPVLMENASVTVE